MTTPREVLQTILCCNALYLMLVHFVLFTIMQTGEQSHVPIWQEINVIVLLFICMLVLLLLILLFVI